MNSIDMDEEDFIDFEHSFEEEQDKRVYSKHEKYPWIKSSSKVHNVPIRFHMEIMEFYNLISPSEQNIHRRRQIFENIRDTIAVSPVSLSNHI